MSFSIAGPAEVKGFYQKIRNFLQPALIILFLAAPWIQIHGKPLLLFDIFQRHFVFFGSTFYSHEAPLLFFLVILLVLSIFLVTAIYGRLWCGWTCPQTVFLNSVFNRVERWVLGSYSRRMLFYNAEDSLAKKLKILLLYGIFLFLCWVLSHSFVAYFLGADVITKFVLEGPTEHLNTFVVCTVMTIVLFFNFTFFREKLCLYVCPYGRFQNALIDRNSLVVTYDQMRGEPRGKQASDPSDRGDCVDCKRCVTVCPMKIDIRDGFQFDCISCGQCIDACDTVMEKIKRPTRLIRYETGNQKPITLMRFRLGLYALLMILFSSGFAWSLYQRSDVDIQITRSHQIPFSSRLENGKKILQNQIQLHIKNQTQLPQDIVLSLSSENQTLGYRLLTPAINLQLEPGQDLKTIAFVEIGSEQFVPDQNEIAIDLKMQSGSSRKSFKFVRRE